MNDTIEKIAWQLAEEECLWKGLQITETMLKLDNYSQEELTKLGWSFVLQRIGGTNVLMWGRVDDEQNFIEESRFESKAKQKFEATLNEIEYQPYPVHSVKRDDVQLPIQLSEE